MPKRRHGSKERAQRFHAKTRALERYDIALNNKDLQAIAKLIQDRKAIFVEKQSLRVTLWDVDYNGIRMRTVYDRHRKQIVTVLPLDPPVTQTQETESLT